MRPINIRTAVLLLISLAVVLSLLPGCGDSRNETDPNGYITFSLQWPGSFSPDVAVALKGGLGAPSGDVCQDYLIQTINVNVYTSGNALVTNASFSCSAHTGFVTVAPGTGYSVVVDGVTTWGSDWRGQKTGVNVTQGNVTNAGSVAMAYIGTDTVRPAISSTNPVSNATSVPVMNAITAVFSENMAAFTIDTSTFIVTRGSANVTGTISYNSVSRTATFLPSANLSTGQTYSATITTGVKDLAMNAMLSNYTWSFTTETSQTTTGIWDSMVWDAEAWH